MKLSSEKPQEITIVKRYLSHSRHAPTRRATIVSQRFKFFLGLAKFAYFVQR